MVSGINTMPPSDPPSWPETKKPALTGGFFFAQKETAPALVGGALRPLVSELRLAG
jgi:hypothetical protein